MSFLFTASSLLPALHLDDSLWPVAPWQWLGAHQGPIIPLQEEDAWEPYRVLKSSSLMESNAGAISPFDGPREVAGHDGKDVPVSSANKAKQSQSWPSSLPKLPNWEMALLHSAAPTLASYQEAVEQMHRYAATTISIIPSIRQQSNTILDLPQMLSNSLETKVVSDKALPSYTYEPSQPMELLSGPSVATLQVGKDAWVSNLAQAPPTMKPIEWLPRPQSSRQEVQGVQPNAFFHASHDRQEGYEYNTNLWSPYHAYQDAHYSKDNGPIQVHFHQPLIGHMQVQGTTPQDVRLFKEQVEEALVDIFNNVKTMYPS